MAKREMMASSKKHPHYDDNDGMMRIPGNGAHLPLSLSVCVSTLYTHTLFKNFNFSHELTIRKTLMSRQNMFCAHVRHSK